MLRRFATLVAIGGLCVAVAGCGRSDDAMSVDRSTAVSPPTFALSTPVTLDPSVPNSTDLDGYLIEFTGRTVANNQTTFSYSVTRHNPTHALNFFVLEIPPCAPAPASTDPGGASIGSDPQTGLTGVKWPAQLALDETRAYSVTFPGDVPLGLVHTAVKLTSSSPIGVVGGPCGGFRISGAVFTDADQSGARTVADEPGISGVSVTLEDAAGNTETVQTDAAGAYTFVRFDGTYTVRIDAATSADDFNETLAANFDATGGVSVSVTVGPDSPDNDFGYFPRTTKIITDVQTGVLITTGEPPKYWGHQVRGGGKADYDEATVLGFISEIQGLYLPDPFQFTPGNELKEVLAILNPPTKDPINALLSQLLAAEFNHVSGKGLVGQDDLQGALLEWAESVAAQYIAGQQQSATTATKGDSGPAAVRTTTSTPTVDGAIDLLGTLNGATGGGGSGGEG